MLCVHESALDKQNVKVGASDSNLPFSCNWCTKSFCSKRALDTHARKTHAVRTPFSKYVDGTGACPVCKSVFSTRLRVLAHLADARKRGRASQPCGPRLLEGSFHTISLAAQTELDLQDKLARRLTELA